MDRNTINAVKRRSQAGILLALGAVIAMPVSGRAASFSGPTSAVIVRGDGTTSQATVDATVTAFGGHMTRDISILDGGLAVVPAAALDYLSAAPGIAQVTPDGKLTFDSIGGYDPTADATSLYSTTQTIGAQALWAKGITGKGIGVAVIDTGVAPVPGLNGSDQVFNGPDLSFDSQTPALTNNDEYGHGTAMAGIIAGNDSYGASDKTAYAGNSNQFTGVAPDSHILSVKVADENGVVDVSQVLAAIDWVVQHKNDNKMNIRVLNLSFGTDSTQPYTLDPLTFADEVAWHAGITVVAAAGNNGNSANGLANPAMDPYVIAVGAADTQGTVSTSDDTVASFSSFGNGTRNPDVVAPGVHIASLRDPGSNIDQQFGSTATVSTNGRFFRGSGTSQATAVVSGAAALLLSAQGMNPDQVKRELVNSATPLANQPATAQGAGEINAPAAVAVKAGGGAQSFIKSTGTGSLDAARGSLHVVNNGVALSGEQDIFGNVVNSAQIAQAEASGAAWSTGNWNGAAWSGAAWSGTTWSGAAWSGAAWSGAAWSGAAWSGATWTGAAWSGAAWSGAAWSGAAWSGAAWSGAAWSGAGWSDYSWS